MRVTSAWILLLLLGALGLAQNSDPAIAISGIVKDSVTGRGIAGASISLVAGPSKAEIASFRAQATQGGTANNRAFPQFSNLHAVTGEDGTFTFSLAEPSYATMQVTRSGYLPVNKGLGNDFKSSVAISLVPLGVIEGRVVDLDGEPLVGIVMDLIQPTIIDGRKIYRQLTAVRTDDRGQYRLWNLAPGSAYLRAAGRQTILARANGAPTPPEADHAYPAVYFPNAPDRQSASAIQIQPGQTAHADFTLEPQKSYRIRGVIRDVSSFTRLGVRLLRGEDSAGNRASVDTTTGAFVIYDVTPGTYTVQAFANGGKSLAMGELEITTGPQDLSGLEIALSTGVRSAERSSIRAHQPFRTILSLNPQILPADCNGIPPIRPFRFSFCSRDDSRRRARSRRRPWTNKATSRLRTCCRGNTHSKTSGNRSFPFDPVPETCWRTASS